MESNQDQIEPKIPAGHSRNPLLLLLGFLVLGIALALLLFGGTLFNREAESPAKEGVLSSVPEFSDTVSGDVIVAEIPEGTAGMPQVGEKAPDFPALDLAGNRVNLADFAGQPVIINFWATWCAPCLIEMPALQAAFEQFQDEGLVILALNREENAETVTAYFYDELGLTFTPLLDQEAIAANMFGVLNMPTTYFVDATGNIAAVHRGPMTLGQIEGYLAETLPSSG